MKKYGFTLLELLLVIAVLALLLSILVPALIAAKNRAHSIQCGANIYQLSLGFSVYQQDTNALPYGFWDLNLMNPPIKPEDGFAGYATHDRQGLWWFNFLQQTIEFDLKKDSFVWCPGRKFIGPVSENNVLCGNYGVNRSVFRDARSILGCQFFGEPLRFNEINKPASTFLISDSGYSLISWFAATETTNPVFENTNRIDAFYIPGLGLNQKRPELLNQPDAIKGRHPNRKINIGFADGHTESRSADSLEINTNAANNGNIPSLWEP